MKKSQQIVQGTVTDVDGNPVVGAVVSIKDGWTGAALADTITDRDGLFTFEKVAPGWRLVTAESADAQLAAGDVTVAAGADVHQLKLQFHSQGIVSGRVVDETDKPIEGALAEILHPNPDRPISGTPPGTLALAIPATAKYFTFMTNADGEFRFLGVPPGEYVIRVSAQALPLRSAYPTTYYPNVTDSASAGTVVVNGGKEALHYDIRVNPTGVRVKGRLMGARIEPSRFFLISRNPGETVAPPSVVLRQVGTDGFEVLGVAAGSYFLYYKTSSPAIAPTTPEEYLSSFALKAEWIRTPVEVGAQDVDNVTLVAVQPGRLSGRFVIDPEATDADKVDLSDIKLTIGYGDIVPTIGLWEASPQVDGQGRFALPRVSEGNLRLREVDLADGWFVSGIRQDGEDAMASGVSVAAGQSSALEVVISNFGGSIVGTIHDAENNPLPACRYVLLPEASRRDDPLFVQSGTSYEKGGFRIEGIPPGEYTLIAFPDEPRFSTTFVRNIKSISQYEAFGQHVHVGAGQTTQVTATVVPSI